jgi:DNA-binding Lrp family transcriptional regulator
MDKKTRRILHELSKNARTPLKQLAKKVSLSESTLSYRLTQLHKEEIILGTAPIIDHSKLNHIVYRIYASFFGTTTKKEQEIFNWLKQQKAVLVLASVQGEYDILIMSAVSSSEKFHDFLKNFKEKYRKFIGTLETFTYLKTYHFSRDYLIENEERTTIVTGESQKEKIDELDKKILRSLATDARKPVLQISKEINVPVRTVSNRLKLLEKKKIILGYSLNLNLNKIEREYYKLNIIGNENIDYSSLINFAAHLDSSIYVDETIGKYDFELNVEVKNKQELNEIINSIKEKMKGIRHLNLFQINKYLKLTYLGD